MAAIIETPVVVVTFNDVFTLLWWWALWSLADAYLLAFTPCSELVVLGACFVIWLWPDVKRRANTGLQKVTQTNDI